MSKPTADELIAHFNMIELYPEGGYVAETHRSTRMFDDTKHAATAILYLLRAGERHSVSALHRLPTDEVYHFYLGDPVLMLLLHPNGRAEQITLGRDVLNGERVQVVVPAGVWQSVRLLDGGAFALMGTTMAPGFDPSDYEGGARDALIAQYPGAADEIRLRTRPDDPTTMEEA